MSLALLAYLFSTTRPRARSRSGCARPTCCSLVGRGRLLLRPCSALATWRWRLLLEALGVGAPLRRLTASYLVATFFNNFLPSNIGGDIVRVRDGSRLTGSTTASLAVVGIDRILGFGALYVLGRRRLRRSAGPRLRELAGARVVLAGPRRCSSWPSRYVFFRPGHRPRG